MSFLDKFKNKRDSTVGKAKETLGGATGNKRILLVQGLPDVDVLWSANVLSNGPQAAGRVAVALLVALGAGFVVGGIAAVRRLREAELPEPTARVGGPA